MTAIIVSILALVALIGLAFWLGRALENEKQAKQTVAVIQEVQAHVQNTNQTVAAMSDDALRNELLSTALHQGVSVGAAANPATGNSTGNDTSGAGTGSQA